MSDLSVVSGIGLGGMDDRPRNGTAKMPCAFGIPRVHYCRNGPRAASRSVQEVRKFDSKLTKENFYAILGMAEMSEM